MIKSTVQYCSYCKKFKFKLKYKMGRSYFVGELHSPNARADAHATDEQRQKGVTLLNVKTQTKTLSFLSFFRLHV
jgi:hypothetical protein